MRQVPQVFVAPVVQVTQAAGQLETQRVTLLLYMSFTCTLLYVLLQGPTLHVHGPEHPDLWWALLDAQIG